MMKRVTQVKDAAVANPATATASVGIVVSIVGRWLGWSDQLLLDITSLALVAVPVVRGIVAWWESRHPV